MYGGGNTNKNKNDLTCWTSMESNLPDREEEQQFTYLKKKIEFGNSKISWKKREI